MGVGDEGCLFFASAVVVEVIAYFIIDSFVAGGCVNVMCFIGVDAVIVDDDGLFFGFERWRREGWLRLFRGGGGSSAAAVGAMVFMGSKLGTAVRGHNPMCPCSGVQGKPEGATGASGRRMVMGSGRALMQPDDGRSANGECHSDGTP
jgi:hypothetical protein